MKPLRVLLVDDEEEFVVALAERLQLRGFAVRAAFSGEQALGMIADEVPEVMVLDLKMPGIDGLEVLRRVRRNEPQLRVVILTGHGSEKDAEAARRLGAVEYLQKPADIQEIVRILRQVR